MFKKIPKLPEILENTHNYLLKKLLLQFFLKCTTTLARKRTWAEKELGPLGHATSPHWLEILILLKFRHKIINKNFKSSTNLKNILIYAKMVKVLQYTYVSSKRSHLIGLTPIFFGTWTTPHHRSLNMFPSTPKIEACFLIVLSTPVTPRSLQLIYIDKPPYSLSLFLSLSHIFKMKLKLKIKNL